MIDFEERANRIACFVHAESGHLAPATVIKALRQLAADVLEEAATHLDGVAMAARHVGSSPSYVDGLASGADEIRTRTKEIPKP